MQSTSEQIEKDEATERYKVLRWKLIRYANLNPDEADEHTLCSAFSFIHKNSRRFAADSFISEALHIADLFSYAAKAPDGGQSDGLTISDYEEVLGDHRRLVRELDVALNGEDGAAPQASLCDIVDQVKAMKREFSELNRQGAIEDMLAAMELLFGNAYHPSRTQAETLVNTMLEQLDIPRRGSEERGNG